MDYSELLFAVHVLEAATKARKQNIPPEVANGDDETFNKWLSENPISSFIPGVLHPIQKTAEVIRKLNSEKSA
ncbi:MAG TPA: hypothetical protein VM571_14655 [Noviherbaspirillum sp.]|jgi:hypothetical protein|nr:hypothetical protein [Noviherbaspirillum sp.]